MRAWQVVDPGPIDSHPLSLADLEDPLPGPGEVRIRVVACGVCRTDLHLAEGDLKARRFGVVPGHEVVGIVDALGEDARRFSLGDRIGIAWLASTCGHCRFCLSDRENLCLEPTFTGWDRDGGFAELALVDERFAYALPSSFDNLAIAPLLCAGIIGYRALRRADLPTGGRLGLYGFGGSAHLTAQVALSKGARLFVFTRSEEDRELARELGATFVGAASDPSPEPLDSAILFAPVGTLVPPALAALDRGGTLAIAGIYLSDIPTLNYSEHLFEERTLRSVTANTRHDGEDLLSIAEEIGMRATTRRYDFTDVNQALSDLANDRFAGAAVIDLESLGNGSRPRDHADMHP